MTDERCELVRCAYEQCSAAYAADLAARRYAWTLFYVRSAVLLAAAAYLCIYARDFAWIAALLLVMSAVMTWATSERELRANRFALQKAITAGLYLEAKHPELGVRFKLDAWGRDINESNRLADLWEGPRRSEEVRLHELGLLPNPTLLLALFIILQLVLAVQALDWWMTS